MSDKKHAHKFEALNIGQTTHLKTMVWYLRTGLRDVLNGRDVLDVEKRKNTGVKVRHAYRQIDEFMSEFFPRFTKTTSKKMALKRVRDMIDELGYVVVDADETKPWGAFYRLDNSQVDRFIHEFFPGLSLQEARLGNDGVELSPKFLLVSPGHRLSWQYHERRAERWRFLTKGAYYKSHSDAQGKLVKVMSGTVVQFSTGERHRLCSYDSDSYTLVAEIWQHTDSDNPSDEADITRLSDDYKR